MRISFIVGALISAALVLFIGQQINFHQLILSFKSAQAMPLAIAVLMIMSTLLIKAWRWRYLLKPIKVITSLNLLSATSIGAMVDMIFPARPGDVVRAYTIGQKEKVNTMTSLATIVVERIWDLLSILLILIVMLLYFSSPLQSTPIPEELQNASYVLSILCAMFLVILGLLRFRMVGTILLMRTCLRFLPATWLERLTGMIQSFAVGLQAVKVGWNLVLILLLSLCIWGTFALSNFLILRSFDLDLPLYAPVYLLVFQVLGISIPSAPGFFGTYHAAVISAFAFLNVPQGLAISIAIIMHAAFFFPFICLGLLFLWKEHFSLRDLWSLRFRKPLLD